MKGFLRVLEGIALFGFAFLFLRWFIKGLFGKYFILFWLWLFLAIGIYVLNQNRVEESYDHRTGAEVWKEKYSKIN
jgi:uncharacterized membrane protein